MMAMAVGKLVIDIRKATGRTGTLSIPPNISLINQRCPVTPPITSRPPQTLLQKVRIILQRRLNLTLLVVLDPRLVLMRNQPPRHKVVVIRVQLVLPPPLRLEAVQEQRILQNLGAKGTCASRHTTRSTVHVVRRGNLKVSPLNVDGPEKIPYPCHPGSGSQPLHTLTGTYSTHFRILKRCQQPWKNCARPRHIIVGQYHNLRLHHGDRLADLQTFVCDADMVDFNSFGRRQGIDEPPQFVVFIGRRHQDELGQSCGQNTLECFSQLLHVVMDCRNNDSDILWLEGGVLGYRLRFVSPVSNAIDDESEIAVDASPC